MIKNVVLEYLLEPEYLDKNYKTTILSLLGDKYTGKSQKFGLIKSVDELKEIYDALYAYNYDFEYIEIYKLK